MLMFYLNVQRIEYTFRIHLPIKKYFKIVENLQCILKSGNFYLLNLLEVTFSTQFGRF